MSDFNLIPLLDYIDPDDYGTWTSVGMALHKEGYSLTDWENWSSKSSKYHYGECERKWDTFGNYGGSEVSGGTIVNLAKQNGWTPEKTASERKHRIFDWDDIIGKDLVDQDTLEISKIPHTNLPQRQQLIKYIETLFQADDIVGYVVKSMQKEEKFIPADSGIYTRTAGQILEILRRGTIEDAIGTYNPMAGAWMRINPLDGKGVKNDNVTDFKYALVESDSQDIEKQYSILKALKLPIATLTHSGSKSLHAIVKVFADNKEEYAKRVKMLYQICEKNGLVVDTQNRNPSRLSRMAGINRGSNKQYLVATNIGCKDWDEWMETISLIDSKLPKTLAITTDIIRNPIGMPPVIIEGILRRGGKMMISSNPKAGKTMLAIQLALAMASGGEWLGHKCKRGRVLFIDGEVGVETFQNRLVEVFRKMGISEGCFYDDDGKPMILYENHVGNYALMEETENFITNHKDENIALCIVDPIYLLLQGDENKASDVIKFTKFISRIKEGLGCAVAYVHHHSKGAQGDKYSIDRAAGSGVFARDADAIVDLSALEVPQEERQQFIDEDKVTWLNDYAFDNASSWGYVDGQVGEVLQAIRDSAFINEDMDFISKKLEEIEKRKVKAYQVSGTLRSFPDFEPFNVVFKYPLHKIDDRLEKSYVKGSLTPQEQGAMANKEKAANQRQKRDEEFREVIESMEAMTQKSEFTAEEIYKEFDTDVELKTFKKWLRQSKILDSKCESGGTAFYSLK